MTQAQTNSLTHTECLSIKAIAIIGIILHNFCHWLPGITHENEFQFNIQNITHLNDALSHPDSQLFLHLLSYFGHYGVVIFVFLSGYGLVQKYEIHPDSSQSPPSLLKFIKIHYLKLLILLLPGFFIITLWNLYEYHRYNDPLPPLNHIIAQIGMYINFYPNPGDIINPGPYWFFGMILQLYILYKLIIQKKHWSIPVILIIFCTTIQLFFNPNSPQLDWMHYNFLGNMLPFGLGILTARHLKIQNILQLSLQDSNHHTIKEKCLYGFFFVVSSILIYLTSLNYYSWFLTPIFAILASLYLIKLLPQKAIDGLKYPGMISAGLFVFHPIARRWFVYDAQQGNIAYGLTMYIAISIIGGIIFTMMWKKINMYR